MIKASNLSYRVGDNRILDNVSVTIETGRITAILGPNGAGKSTLLKCLTGSWQPNTGTITLDGKPLRNYSLDDLSRKRAVLSQSNPINFPFKAVEIVMMGRNPYAKNTAIKSDMDATRQVLQSLDAWHLREHILTMLSGGEQQRIQLARVLVQLWEQENAYLFLDEPTAALDLKHQHRFLCLASQMAEKRQFAVCIIMHDLHLALRYANQVILLKDGKLFASGNTQSVLTSNNIVRVFEIPAEFALSYQLC